MPQLEYFLVADSLSVDQFTNRISIFNVVEVLQGPKFPYRFRLTAISAWNLEPEDGDQDFQAMLVVKSPGVKKPIQVTSNFRMDNIRARIIQNIEGAIAAEAGELIIEIKLNGEHIASHRITVLPPPPPPLNT